MSTNHHKHLTDAMMKAALPTILANMPEEWKGTTFANSALLGREKFSTRMADLVATKGTSITTQDLIDLGNAEDYLRVASNICTTLEIAVAASKNMDITQVFSFSSNVMPLIAVLFSSSQPVHYHVGANSSAPFDSSELELLSQLGLNLTVHQSDPVSHGDDIVVATKHSDAVDAVIDENFLYICNTEKISSANILRKRKRMATPMTTPMALAMLQSMAGVPVTYNQDVADAASANKFYSHLQELSGVAVDEAHHPVCFTTGLSAIAGLWFSLVSGGGADIVMGSTAYGGSSELTDILNSRAGKFHKHTYDITGTNPITPAIQMTLDKLAADPASLMPTTVLFVEIPTNPDMKVPTMEELAVVLSKYETTTGKKVLMLVDTTFAPGSQVFRKVQSVAPNLTTMVFISMSKSVSRGKTTAGTIVAGPSAEACELIERVRSTAKMMDTTARPDQLYILTQNHEGVAERCEAAYNNARTVGDALQQAVKTHCGGYDMPLAFVTREQAAMGFYTSTYSFNLPPIKDAASGVNEGLAQKFVDVLTVDPAFKPCVSFGQDNGLVYATVPATSTQGAIKLEDKAKQAVGGVQLVRLSFPPSCDVNHLCNKMNEAVCAAYK